MGLKVQIFLEFLFYTVWNVWSEEADLKHDPPPPPREIFPTSGDFMSTTMYNASIIGPVCKI